MGFAFRLTHNIVALVVYQWTNRQADPDSISHFAGTCQKNPFPLWVGEILIVVWATLP